MCPGLFQVLPSEVAGGHSRVRLSSVQLLRMLQRFRRLQRLRRLYLHGRQNFCYVFATWILKAIAVGISESGSYQEPDHVHLKIAVEVPRKR